MSSEATEIMADGEDNFEQRSARLLGEDIAARIGTAP
jgi:hypothetical protein